jgi:hypothetical protein
MAPTWLGTAVAGRLLFDQEAVELAANLDRGAYAAGPNHMLVLRLPRID